MYSFNFVMLTNYRNHGQAVEQSIRAALTGEVCKADNVPHYAAADCGGYQIKAARATVCKGESIAAYIAEDAATAYIYGAKDGTAYLLTPAEWVDFCERFAKPDRESRKNGGGIKYRLPNETRAMLAYLQQA